MATADLYDPPSGRGITPVTAILTPTSGSASGGTSFSIRKIGIDTSDFYDEFLSPTLSPHWTNVSYGGSSIENVDGHLALFNNQSGVASIVSTGVVNVIDVDLEFLVSTSDFRLASAPYPLTIIKYSFTSNDGLDIFNIEYQYIGSTGTFRLYIYREVISPYMVTVVVDKVVTGIPSAINIFRYYNKISVSAGSEQLCAFNNWSILPANISISTIPQNSCPNVFNFKVVLKKFLTRMVVMFGGALARQLGYTDGYSILGVTSGYPKSGVVDVIVFSPLDFIIMPSAYEYINTTGLVLTESGATLLISDDPVLRT